MKSLSRICLFTVTLVAAPIASVWAAEDTESKKPEPVKITSENPEIETTEFKLGESKNPDLEKTELKAAELEKATETAPKDDPEEIKSSIVKVKTVESTTVESTTTADIVVKPISINIPGEPKYFDWILLTNGELLKGEIISMYQDSMDFDSDELGSIDIDMDDIAQLRGNEIMSIRFSNDEVIEGKMMISNGKMSFMEHPNKVFSAKDILGIAASEKSGKSLWTGDVSLGVNYRSGNTEKFDYSGQIKLSRLTATDRILINTATNYSKIKDADTGEDIRTIQNTRISASYDWFYSRKIFFRLPGFDYYTDEFKNIDYQVTLGVATGYIIYDEPGVAWDVYIGPSVLYTAYENVDIDEEDTQTSPVIEVGTHYNLDLTKDIEFFFDYTVKFVNEESGKALHHLETGFDIELINDFDLNIKAIVDRVDAPIPDENNIEPEKSDVLMVVGVKYSF